MGLDPKLWAQIDLGASAFGGVMQAGGKVVEGFAANQQAQYEAAALRNNAYLANEAAKAALEAGKVQTQERQVERAQTIGQQRAGFAGRGIVVDRDTADVLAADAMRIGKYDEITIMENARRQALAYKLQGINYSMEAKSTLRTGKGALYGGLLQGAGSLLNSAGTVSAKWTAYQDQYGSASNDPYVINPRDEVFGG